MERTSADFAPAPISTARAAALGLATVAIVARITDPLHGGLGLALPEPAYSVSCGLTLAGAIGVATVWVVRYRPGCKRMRIRGLIERGTRLTPAERLFAIAWAALGLHAAMALLG